MALIELPFCMLLFFILKVNIFVQLYSECHDRTIIRRFRLAGLLRSHYSNVPFTQLSHHFQRDASDDDWEVVLLWISYLLWGLVYLCIDVAISKILYAFKSEIKFTVRVLFSLVFLFHLTGTILLIDVVLLTMTGVCLAMFITSRPLYIWSYTMVILIGSNYLLDSLNFKNRMSSTSYTLFYSAHFLSLLRATSVTLTIASRYGRSHTPSTQSSYKLAIQALDYTIFPYTFFLGPLSTFEDWLSFHDAQPKTNSMQIARLTGRIRSLTLSSLVCRAIRLCFWFLFWFYASCLIYPNAVVVYNSHLTSFGSEKQNWKVFVFAAHLAGVQFYFLHMLCYGIPCLFTDILLYANGRSLVETCCTEMKDLERKSVQLKSVYLCLLPAPPSCVYHISLYSEMWRTFDRGLYGFILCHIYYPLMGTPDLNRSPIRRLLCLALPFFFVLTYHSLSYGNFVWTCICLLQITMEKLIKYMYDQHRLGRTLHERLGPNNIQRLEILLRSVSWMFSFVGFMYFRFGFAVGLQYTRLLFSTHGFTYMMTDLILCQYVIVYARCRSGYNGFPMGYTLSRE